MLSTILMFYERILHFDNTSKHMHENTNELVIETIKSGNGHAPQPGNKVTVHYVLYFEDGR